MYQECDWKFLALSRMEHLNQVVADITAQTA